MDSGAQPREVNPIWHAIWIPNINIAAIYTRSAVLLNASSAASDVNMLTKICGKSSTHNHRITAYPTLTFNSLVI